MELSDWYIGLHLPPLPEGKPMGLQLPGRPPTSRCPRSLQHASPASANRRSPYECGQSASPAHRRALRTEDHPCHFTSRANQGNTPNSVPYAIRLNAIPWLVMTLLPLCNEYVHWRNYRVVFPHSPLTNATLMCSDAFHNRLLLFRPVDCGCNEYVH